MNPINDMSLMEGIRFFAQMVGTEGIPAEAAAIANEALLELMREYKEKMNTYKLGKVGIKLMQ